MSGIAREIGEGPTMNLTIVVIPKSRIAVSMSSTPLCRATFRHKERLTVKTLPSCNASVLCRATFRHDESFIVFFLSGSLPFGIETTFFKMRNHSRAAIDPVRQRPSDARRGLHPRLSNARQGVAHRPQRLLLVDSRRSNSPATTR